jgi:zinc protease
MNSRFVFSLAVPMVLAAATPMRLPETAGRVLRSTLRNGLQVVIVHDSLAPVATTVMNYRVGSDEAPARFPGIAHAQEHMMFRGSAGLSADQLATIGAEMGGMFNADTEQSDTQYTFTVPVNDLDVALHIEAIRMRSALDTEALWSRERGAIEQEVDQDLSSPEYVLYARLLQILFRGTPYEHDALGTRPSFDRTTGQMLRRFHNTWYAPNNAVLVIAGNIEPHAAMAEVQRLFAQIPRRPLPPRPAFRFGEVQPETIRLNTDLPYGMAVIAFRTAGSDSPDFAASQVMEDVLNSQRGSLYELTAEGKALQTGFALITLPRAGLGYALAEFPAGGDAAKVVAQMRSVLAENLKNGFPPDLVAAAQRRTLTSAELRKNSVPGLAMDWSQAVAIEGRSSPDDDVRAIEQVTPADVDRVTRCYLNPDHAVVAILTPRPSGKTSPMKITRGAESLTPTHVKPVALPAWAEQAVMRLSAPMWDRIYIR